MVEALTLDAESKALFYQLVVRMSEEMTEKDYSVFINGIHMRMKIYDFSVQVLKRQIMEV